MLLALLLSLLPPSDVHLADLQRFPPIEMVNQALGANERCREVCLARQSIEPHRAAEWAVILEDLGAIHVAWSALADARQEMSAYGSVTPQERLESLRRLRKIIGPANYMTGTLPPAIPVWRFPTID